MKTGIGQSKYCIPQPFHVALSVFAEVFLTLILFLNDSVHFGDVNPRGVLSYINLIDIALK